MGPEYVSGGDLGLVDENKSSQKETVLTVSGFGPDVAQPLARGDLFTFVFRVGGVSHNLPPMLQRPGVVHVLEQ